MRLIANDTRPDKAKHTFAPISPGESHLAFHEESLNASHGCNACHGAHNYETTFAAKDACLSCHKDEHSLSFESSKHGILRKAAIDQGLPLENTVSCATCHMPRISAGKIKVENGTLDAKTVSDKAMTTARNGESDAAKDLMVELWRVQHNQNWNLRPNEKMIRPVCMNCHGLEFAIDALADPELIKSNFSGQPSKHVESVDWVLERDKR